MDKYEVFLRAHVPKILLQSEIILDDGQSRGGSGDEFRQRFGKSGAKQSFTTLFYGLNLFLLIVLLTL